MFTSHRFVYYYLSVDGSAHCVQSGAHCVQNNACALCVCELYPMCLLKVRKVHPPFSYLFHFCCIKEPM